MEALRWSFEHGEPAGTMRRQAHAVLGEWLTAADLEDAMVVISELVQNVTQHTSGGGELVVVAEHGVITIEVRDRNQVLPRALPPDSRRLGGRGLLLVAGVTRAWGAHSTADGKVVWAQLALSSGAAVQRS